MHYDYTMHKDEARRQRYITRHQKNEVWTANGVQAAGFWSRQLLWSLTTLQDSIRGVNKIFNINVNLI